MGRVNVWLRRALVVVLVLIAVVGLLLLGITLFSHGHLHKDEEIEDMMLGLNAMYAIAVVTIILVAIGLFGAIKDKQWALIIYVCGTILSSLFLFGVGIHAHPLQSEIELEVKTQYLAMLPLSNTSNIFVDTMNDLQKEFECCGLEKGFEEWDNQIPDSCLCNEDSTNACVEPPSGTTLGQRLKEESIMIYADPCLPFVEQHVKDVVKTFVIIIMAVLSILVLSIVLAIVTLCQLRKSVDTPPVVYSQQAKAGQYITLSERMADA